MKMLVVLFVCCAFCASGQVAHPPSNLGHESGTVESRGDTGMGFSQEKTTHHFRLYADGGAIQVTANDSNDNTDINAIRTHLQHIAKMFAAGNFSLPMFIHDRVPPGVPELEKAKDAVSYQYEEIPSGAKVRIETSDKELVKAVHEFLKFQIADHHTGDVTTVSSVK